MSEKTEYTIIMIGSAAGSKAFSLLEEKWEELKARYPERYLKAARARITEELRQIDSNQRNATSSHIMECGEDGVFGALWRLGEELSTGLEVNLYDIPIDQAVIELCDHEDINPYEADSTGAYLVATATPGSILKSLEEQVITARIIGYTTAENAKVIKGPTVRYLTRV